MRSSATATASARRKAGSIVMTVPPWRIRSAANAVSDAVGERDRRAVLGGDLDLVDALPELGADLGGVRRAHRLPWYNLSADQDCPGHAATASVVARVEHVAQAVAGQ